MESLVLASTSRWRRKMLEAAGLAVGFDDPGVDERAIEAALRRTTPATELPVTLVRALAEAKARAVLDRHPGKVVLAADQVGYDPAEPGDPFGKPADPDAHLARLRSLVGRTHHLVTGWAVARGGEIELGHAISTLTVRADLGDEELRAYVANGEGAGCAGGYAVDGVGAFLFERIDGDWNNVIGFPLFDVWSALRRRGWRFR